MSSLEDSAELQHSRFISDAKLLTKQLLTKPSNLTNLPARKNETGFDCRTYGYALRQYLIDHQDQYSIRQILTNRQDVLQSLDENSLMSSLEKLRCQTSLRTDKSTFHYIKYVVQSLRLFQLQVIRGRFFL